MVHESEHRCNLSCLNIIHCYKYYDYKLNSVKVEIQLVMECYMVPKNWHILVNTVMNCQVP